MVRHRASDVSNASDEGWEPARQVVCAPVHTPDSGLTGAAVPLRDDSRVELTTARLHLRPFLPEDHEAIHAVYADPEVMRYVGHGAHRSMAETVRALRVYADILATHGYSFLAVVERGRGVVVGDAGLNPLGGRGPDVELGYTVARADWGRGYATEIGRALVDHAFTTLGVSRVVAQVEPANAASRHVLEKLGMTAREERVAYGRPHLLYAVERRPAPPAAGTAASERPIPLA
jgi:[ribosomal protein S5]-alanine N-acetyltransferase